MSPSAASRAIANSMLLNPSPNATQTAALKAAATKADKTRAAAEDFEAVFLNTLFQQMFSGVGLGPIPRRGTVADRFDS